MFAPAPTTFDSFVSNLSAHSLRKFCAPKSVASSVTYFLLFSFWFLFAFSGGHVNPVVTLSLFLIGEVSFVRMVFYWIAQLLGSVAGSAIALVRQLPLELTC